MEGDHQLRIARSLRTAPWGSIELLDAVNAACDAGGYLLELLDAQDGRLERERTAVEREFEKPWLGWKSIPAIWLRYTVPTYHGTFVGTEAMNSVD